MDLADPTRTDVTTPIWTTPIWWTASATLLALSLQVDDGMLHPVALAFVTLALLAAFRGIANRPVATFERHGELALDGALALGIGAEIVAHLIRFPSIYFKPVGAIARLPFYAAMAAVAALVGLALRHPARSRATRLFALLAVFVALGIWIIPNAPDPPIDVFIFQRDSAAALLAGHNPYALTFPDLYHGTSPYYGPGMSVGGRLQFGFVYPPLSLLLAVPGYLIGDVRYAHLAAMTLAGALIACARPGLGRTGFLAAALFLFSPRAYLVVERAWTEPFVIVLLALVAFCACRRPRALPYAVGLFLASKQYLVLAVPLLALLWPPPWRWRVMGPAALKAAAVAIAVTLPLAVWDLRAFTYSVAELQFYQPFRHDALSYLAAYASLTGHEPSSAFSFLAALAAMIFCLRRCPRTPAGFSAAFASTYFAFFAFNKQAFCNYYYLVLGALCLAVATWPFEPASEERVAYNRLA